MKKYVARILVLVLVFSMAGCSSTTPPATTATTTAAATPGTTATAVPETVEFPKFLTVGGGSTGGVFFSAAAGIAQMITNNTGCTATAQTTTGGGLKHSSLCTTVKWNSRSPTTTSYSKLITARVTSQA